MKHTNIQIGSALGFKDVLVYRNPKTWKKYYYCKVCGTLVSSVPNYIDKHTNQCNKNFRPLCIGETIPNEEISAYSNLEDHILNGVKLIAKQWLYRTPS